MAQGGKSFQDRKVAAEVRRLALRRIKELLEKPKVNPTLYSAVLIRLSGTVLPKLTEVTGEDGEAIEIKIAKEIAEKLE